MAEVQRLPFQMKIKTRGHLNQFLPGLSAPLDGPVGHREDLISHILSGVRTSLGKVRATLELFRLTDRIAALGFMFVNWDHVCF